MTITIITPTTPVCFGVLCNQHAKCQRYHAVDGAPAHQHRIGTCDNDSKGEWPLFVAVQIKEAA